MLWEKNMDRRLLLVDYGEKEQGHETTRVVFILLASGPLKRCQISVKASLNDET